MKKASLNKKNKKKNGEKRGKKRGGKRGEKRGEKNPLTARKRKELKLLLPILSQIATGSEGDFASILDKVNIPSLKLILECIYNAVYNVKLHNEDVKEDLKKKLEGKQKTLKSMLSKSSSFKMKRNVCTSNRDCVQSLISSILPILNNNV